jgi:small subunit ribosomal protein S4
VYRLGYASSRAEARQLVRHGHFTVNGHRVDIPSYQVKVGDVVAVREKSLNSPRIKELVESSETKTVPAWLERDIATASGRVLHLPTRDEIDTPVQEQMIVELYSR